MSQPPPVSVNGKPSLSRMNARIWSAAGVKNMACTPRITGPPLSFPTPTNLSRAQSGRYTGHTPPATGRQEDLGTRAGLLMLEPPPDLRFIFEVGAAKLRFQVTLFVGDEPAGDPPDKERHHHCGRQAAQQDPEANQDERHGKIEGGPAVSIRALRNQGGRLLEREDRRVVAPELHRS